VLESEPGCCHFSHNRKICETPVKSKPKDVSNGGKLPAAGRIAPSDSPSKSFGIRDIIIVLAVAWVARLAFMWFVPPGARCFDAYSWETEAKVLASGGNPYHANALLNWPPFWMQVIFVISKAAAVLHAPFFRTLQVFLILVESAVIIQLAKLIQEVAPAAPVRKIVLIGIALNPIAILLICQHCNFDIIVALWLLLFMRSLLRYNRSNSLVDWLTACLFLGLGILTKTVPLLLIPMLAGGFRPTTASARFLGAAFLLGPVALGMSIIYVLAPVDITTNVLAYRSQSGYFGISGLMHLAGADAYVGVPNILFYALLLATMTLTGILFWRRQSIGGRETVLYAGLLLAAIPSLGPGYATQYIYWFMPFLVATFAFYTGLWRVVLVGFGLISVCTYIAEYSLYGEYGYNVLYILTHAKDPAQLNAALQTMNSENAAQIQSALQMIQKWSTQRGHILLNLPTFIAFLGLLAFGIRMLLRNISNLRISRAWVGYCSAAMVVLAGLVFGVKYVGSDSRVVAVLESRANTGNAQAQFQLAERYLSGKGVMADTNNAFQWFSKAADQGLADAQYQLALCYAQGVGTAKDLAASVPWFRKAADQGNGDAEYNLGLAYEKGLGIAQDAAQAAAWYQRAAEQGNVIAQNNLGMISLNLNKDYAGAAHWLQQAADRGYAPAQNALGIQYLQGMGVKQDVNEGFKLLLASADQGFADGQNNCGLFYYTQRQLDQSAQCFRKAADQGHAGAQYNLAQFYQKGLVYPQDLGEAFLWYSRSANQGYAPAQFALGKIYFDGQGVPADHVEAYKFFKLAQMQGVPDADTQLAACAATMSQEQITTAENEVKQFQIQK